MGEEHIARQQQSRGRKSFTLQRYRLCTLHLLPVHRGWNEQHPLTMYEVAVWTLDNRASSRGRSALGRARLSKPGRIQVSVYNLGRHQCERRFRRTERVSQRSSRLEIRHSSLGALTDCLQTMLRSVKVVVSPCSFASISRRRSTLGRKACAHDLFERCRVSVYLTQWTQTVASMTRLF